LGGLKGEGRVIGGGVKKKALPTNWAPRTKREPSPSDKRKKGREKRVMRKVDGL